MPPHGYTLLENVSLPQVAPQHHCTCTAAPPHLHPTTEVASPPHAPGTSLTPCLSMCSSLLHLADLLKHTHGFLLGPVLLVAGLRWFHQIPLLPWVMANHAAPLISQAPLVTLWVVANVSYYDGVPITWKNTSHHTTSHCHLQANYLPKMALPYGIIHVHPFMLELQKLRRDNDSQAKVEHVALSLLVLCTLGVSIQWLDNRHVSK